MSDESKSGSKPQHGRLWSLVGTANVWVVHSIAAVISISLLLLFATVTATAETSSYGIVLQENTDAEFMCTGPDNDEQTFLGEVLDTILSFIVISAIPVFIILYQLDGLMEFFALGADTKAKIKKHQRNMWIGAAKIFLAPALISVIAGTLGIGIPDCITVMPWG